MNTFLLIAVIVLAVAVAALFLMLLALAREIGRVQVRLGPLGARMMDTGPKIAQVGPSFRGLKDHLGREIGVGGHRDKAQLLLFTAPSCSTCKSLLPGVKAMAKAEKDLEVVIISDGTPEEHQNFLAGSGIGAELSYVDARDVGIAYQVGTTPYGVILDEHGKIQAKGLCNHMAQVESLLNALESGTPSLQHLHEAAKTRAAAGL
ncbi:methylamine dehydrogenase accessory protein MauD [Rhodococcus rhodochrous J3]|uniref:Redoxin domain-containing protein n=2 Tax=Rhodococcus rhodochrous TaxID=1829 RepID=A0AA46WX18_RHORH|nr:MULTISPECIES: redoxin domain-containing protein [Rhodococcus]AYA24646.1 methylamine utilization protein [Rhodococcus rhodochrous]MCB8911360.1 redoxin domain-containing protein [Rhodococcus rhodochrous]MDC3724722.1 redoxin domain-containing protein [Rhodococcus sp. Rp3]MDJ0397801.1 redoxin domain-containing protein [Rhodococcus rhodochrous]MDO1483767.1 redoxin domain-containing protein [Rhodococcus rhodochrous]